MKIIKDDIQAGLILMCSIPFWSGLYLILPTTGNMGDSMAAVALTFAAIWISWAGIAWFLIGRGKL